MKYRLPELIEAMNVDASRWTDENISKFIGTIKDKGNPNYHLLTRADRKVVSELGDSQLKSYVSSLLSGNILEDAKSEAEQIKNETQQIKNETKRTLKDLKGARMVKLPSRELSSEKTLERMTKETLSIYAQLEGIDLTNKTKKGDILDTILSNFSGLEETVVVSSDNSEMELNGNETLERKVAESDEKRLMNRVYRGLPWLAVGATLAIGAGLGEYTGITDFVDWTHLRG